MENTPEKVHLSREIYRNIKKMNKEELEIYLTNACSTSYNRGVEAMSKIVSKKIVAGLQKTKGIGEKRMKEILISINKELSGE